MRVPKTKLLDWLINGLIACQGPHLQRLPNTCAPCRAYWLSRTKAEHPAEGSCSARRDGRLNNSKECVPGREKSETNPSNHPLPLHRQDTSRTNLTSLKPAEDFFFFFPPEFLLPLSFFSSFLLPPILYHFYVFFLPSFIYFCFNSC